MMELILVWATVLVAFLIGVAWNADAYDRGHRDARDREQLWDRTDER